MRSMGEVGIEIEGIKELIIHERRIIETYTSTKYRKPSKQKEYRIYYYDNNKRLKWFCVSEEVYIKMKDKLNSVLKK